MLILKTNWLNIFVRCIALLLLIILEFLLFKKATHESSDKRYILLCIVFFCMALAFILIAISLSGIIKVKVDQSTGTIFFKSFLITNIVPTIEIDSYYITTYLNPRGKIYHGLQLNLVNKNNIRLAEQNLKSLSDFEEYLTAHNIGCLGEKLLRFLN